MASMYLLTGEADYVENTIIDGDLDESGPGTVLYLEDNSNGNSTKVTLSGFTLTNGSSNGGSDDGGGLYAFELDSLIIDNMIVDGNYNAKQGHDAGGITIKYADFVKITNTTISNNTADRYSGIAIVNSEDVELFNLLVHSNSSPETYHSVYLHENEELKIVNSTIANNTVETPYNSGGLIINMKSSLDSACNEFHYIPKQILG